MVVCELTSPLEAAHRIHLDKRQCHVGVRKFPMGLELGQSSDVTHPRYRGGTLPCEKKSWSSLRSWRVYPRRFQQPIC